MSEGTSVSEALTGLLMIVIGMVIGQVVTRCVQEQKMNICLNSNQNYEACAKQVLGEE